MTVMRARSNAKVAALLLLTAAPNHRAAAYPLIEASGVDPFALGALTAWSWPATTSAGA